MSTQQLVSTKIPPDWVDHLDKLAVTTQLTRSALVKVAIGQYLGLSEVDPAVVAVDLQSQLDDIRARLEALERSTPSTRSSTNTSTSSTPSTDTSTPSTDVSTPSTDVSTKPIAVAKSSTPKTTPPTPTDGLMTVSELHHALTSLGYSKKKGTFGKILNKAIDSQQLPADLLALGVVCRWDIKRSGNPNNNRLRWLSLEPIA